MISKFVNTGSFAVILLCFLLPFISIKCNDTTLVEFKGHDLVIGKNYKLKSPVDSFGEQNKSEDKSEMGSEEQERLSTNWFMVALLLFTVCGAILSLVRLGKKRIAEIICASAGLVSLIIMVAVLSNQLESKAGLGNNEMGLKIRLGYEVGFWLILLTLIGIIIYNSILIVLDSKKKIDPSSPLNNYNSVPPIDKIE